MWLVVAVSGYITLAIVAILDKFIVSGERVKPLTVTFFSTAPLAFILFLVPFNVTWLVGSAAWILALLSGATFTAGLWTMYRSFEFSEISHSGPLVGAATPLFSIFFSRWILGEVITGRELIALGLLVVGSLGISYEQSKRNSGWHRGMLWAVAAGGCFAFSNVAAKYVYDHYGFYSGLVWTRGAIGLSGLVLLSLPSLVRHIFHPVKRSIAAPKKRSTVTVVIVDKILGVAGALLIQYAVFLGSVSLVNALAGVQYASLVILVAVLTAISPRLFKEYYQPGELKQEIIAVFVIAVGLALLIVH